jgi:hypothetical protein
MMPTPLPQMPLEALPAGVPLLLTFPAKRQCIAPGDPVLSPHDGTIVRDFLPLRLATCSRDAAAHQRFVFDAELQQLRNEHHGTCVEVKPHAPHALTLRACMRITQTVVGAKDGEPRLWNDADDAEMLRQRFMWQSSFQTLRSAAFPHLCVQSHAPGGVGTLGSALALSECASVGHYLAIVAFIPSPASASSARVSFFTASRHLSLCLEAQDSLHIARPHTHTITS